MVDGIDSVRSVSVYFIGMYLFMCVPWSRKMFHEGTEGGLGPCEASHTRLGSWNQQTQDRKHRATVIPEGRVQEGGWGDFKGATKVS